MLKVLPALILALQIGQRNPQVRAHLRAGPILRGELIAWELDSFQIRQANDTRTLRWDELVPNQARLVYEQCLNVSNGPAMVKLAEIAWGFDNRDYVELISQRVLARDPTLKAEFERVKATAPGKFLATPTTHGAAPAGNSTGKYQPATPEQHAQAIEKARGTANGVSGELGVKLAEIQTDHFLIFTDWDPREHAFLKQNLENAYALLSKQFEMSPRDNIFIGKLPVYMYADRKTFIKHAIQIDMNLPLSRSAGYYGQSSAGTGRMVMFKPLEEGKTTLEQAKRNWARTLTHEFAHAFIGRYRTNVHIPSWLNEGTAEVIAEHVHKRETARAWARHHAQQTPDVSAVFDDRIKGGDMYPVMMSMVECLIAQDRKAFIKMYDLIKDGTKPEDALRQCYGMDYKGLDKAWRRHALTH
jgi:hypothetical protein